MKNGWIGGWHIGIGYSYLLFKRMSWEKDRGKIIDDVLH